MIAFSKDFLLCFDMKVVNLNFFFCEKFEKHFKAMKNVCILFLLHTFQHGVQKNSPIHICSAHMEILYTMLILRQFD